MAYASSMASTTSRFLLASVTLSALLAGCYDAHDLSSGDGSVSELGPLGDGGVDLGLDGEVMTEDASQPACQHDFAVRTLSIPTLASGVGFDLDGGGTQIGCGVDGVDGIDNALAGLAALTGLVNLDINQLLTAAITFRLVRLRVRLDECGATPTLVMVDANGAPIGTPRDAVVEVSSDGNYTFEGSVEQVPIVLSLPFGGGIQVDISLDEVQLAGTVAGGNLAPMVIGGEIPRERIEALAESFGGVGGLPPGTIEALLADLLDLHIDPNTGDCQAMSGALVATGTEL